MNPVEIPVDSDALRANLPGTAQPSISLNDISLYLRRWMAITV
jgi:hypothetical protein